MIDRQTDKKSDREKENSYVFSFRSNLSKIPQHSFISFFFGGWGGGKGQMVNHTMYLGHELALECCTSSALKPSLCQSHCNNGKALL